MDIGDFTLTGMVASAASVPVGLEGAAAALRALCGAARNRDGTWGVGLVQAFDDDLRDLVRRTSPDSSALCAPVGAADWSGWLSAVRNASEAVTEAYRVLPDESAAASADLRLRMARRLADTIMWRLIDCYEPPTACWAELASLLRPELDAGAGRIAGDVEGLGKEYVRALAYHSAALDQLTLGGALAVCRLVHMALPFLTVSSRWTQRAQYAVNPEGAPVPSRVLGAPTARRGEWFFSSDAAIELLDAFALRLDGGRAPQPLADLDPESSRAAIEHLRMLWSANAPRRRFRRHVVDGGLCVASGFQEILSVLKGVDGVRAQEWKVRNLSKGGVGVSARVARDGVVPDNGRLLCFRFLDGASWLLGMVRRVRHIGAGMEVGIDTLSTLPKVVIADDGCSAIEVLLCDHVGKGEAVRLVGPVDSLKAGIPLFLTHLGTVRKLTPMSFSASGDGFDLRAYQVL